MPKIQPVSLEDIQDIIALAGAHSEKSPLEPNFVIKNLMLMLRDVAAVRHELKKLGSNEAETDVFIRLSVADIIDSYSPTFGSTKREMRIHVNALYAGLIGMSIAVAEKLKALNGNTHQDSDSSDAADTQKAGSISESVRTNSLEARR